MPIIVVLEDDQRRITAMREAVNLFFPEFELQIFVSASELVQWLNAGMHDIQLISLDCDLDATALVEPDCGSGEDVVAYLVQHTPNCPVIIHSSNAIRAPAMHMELILAGWQHVALCPFQNASQWMKDVKQALSG